MGTLCQDHLKFRSALSSRPFPLVLREKLRSRFAEEHGGEDGIPRFRVRLVFWMLECVGACVDYWFVNFFWLVSKYRGLNRDGVWGGGLIHCNLLWDLLEPRGLLQQITSMTCPHSAASSDLVSILLSAFTLLWADGAKLLIACLPGKALGILLLLQDRKLWFGYSTVPENSELSGAAAGAWRAPRLCLVLGHFQLDFLLQTFPLRASLAPSLLVTFLRNSPPRESLGRPQHQPVLWDQPLAV